MFSRRCYPGVVSKHRINLYKPVSREDFARHTKKKKQLGSIKILTLLLISLENLAAILLVLLDRVGLLLCV